MAVKRMIHAVETHSGESMRVIVTGYATYVLDPDDPFPEGFTMGDIWAS